MKTKIYRNSKTSWLMPWIIGFLILIGAIIFKHHFFYIYYYFFFIGLLLLIFSFAKYAVANIRGLSIYYGSLLQRKSIFIPWEIINNTKLGTFKISATRTYGGRIFIPISYNVERPAVILTLKKSISSSHLTPLSKYNRKENFIIKDMGTKIYFTEPPGGGFKKFIYDIDKYMGMVKKDGA